MIDRGLFGCEKPTKYFVDAVKSYNNLKEGVSSIHYFLQSRCYLQCQYILCPLKSVLSSANTCLKGFTVWKGLQLDPLHSSCAHWVSTVRRAPPPLTGYLALLGQQENKWVRQVGQLAKDVAKDDSVLQVRSAK